MTPSTLLHPLKLDVVGFQEDEHDYHFRVELPEPKCCQSCGTLYSLVTNSPMPSPNPAIGASRRNSATLAV